jgi:hypothetical protein
MYWCGLGFSDLASMPMATVQVIYERLPRLKAEHELMLIEANSVVSMKESDRRSVMQRLMLEISGEPRIKARVASPDELARIGIKVVGIGVERIM